MDVQYATLGEDNSFMRTEYTPKNALKKFVFDENAKAKPSQKRAKSTLHTRNGSNASNGTCSRLQRALRVQFTYGNKDRTKPSIEFTL